MTNTLHIQLAVDAQPGAVFTALTDTTRLATWFAEYADVSLTEKHYDFWGKYTPEAPDREKGRHPLLDVAADECLKFGWHLEGHNTAVEFRLERHEGQTLVNLRQEDVVSGEAGNIYTYEDFWFLTLENLRRHLDSKRPVLCDFSKANLGDIQHTLEIDAPRETVFDVLIKPEQLERWIASKATVEAKVGGQYSYGWQMGGPVKILELTPNEKLAVSWPEHIDTVLTWTLESSGGKTRLTLVHSGFAPDRNTGDLYAGWLNFASWIKSIAEYGAKWQPAIKALSPGTELYYPAVIAAEQSRFTLRQLK